MSDQADHEDDELDVNDVEDTDAPLDGAVEGEEPDDA